MTESIARRGIVQTKLGGVHYVTSGRLSSGLTPILAFHMSPRSVDEYTEVMPMLSADGRLVIAIDEMGYGCSDNPIKSCTLDEIAEGALSVANELGVDKFIACGSLMGNFFALSLTSRYAERAQAAILTNCYHFPEAKVDEARAKEEARMQLAEKLDDAMKQTIKDEWEIKDDGSHLTAIFDARKTWLDAHMNTRVTRDDLIYKLNRRERYAAGINIQDGPLFEFEKAARATKCPVICVQGKEATAFFDMIGFEMTSQFEKVKSYLSDLTVVEVDGHINCVNNNAQAWYAEVSAFLAKHT